MGQQLLQQQQQQQLEQQQHPQQQPSPLLPEEECIIKIATIDRHKNIIVFDDVFISFNQAKSLWRPSIINSWKKQYGKREAKKHEVNILRKKGIIGNGARRASLIKCPNLIQQFQDIHQQQLPLEKRKKDKGKGKEKVTPSSPPS